MAKLKLNPKTKPIGGKWSKAVQQAPGTKRARPIRLNEMKNRGGKLLLAIGVFTALLYGLFWALYGR